MLTLTGYIEEQKSKGKQLVTYKLNLLMAEQRGGEIEKNINIAKRYKGEEVADSHHLSLRKVYSTQMRKTVTTSKTCCSA